MNVDKLCKYAILRYVPEQHREEFINIGLVFHCPEDRYSNIQFTSNFSRVKTFDDEVDTDFLKMVLDGLKDDFSRSTTITGPTEHELKDTDFLSKSTAFYVNQLQFSAIRTIISSDIEKDEFDLFRTYVYFDTKKNKRINHDKVKSLLNRVFSDNERHFEFKKDVSVNMDSEDIKVDFVYSNKVKQSTEKNILNSLSFDYASGHEKNALVLAKEWHWNINKIIEMKKHNKLAGTYLNGDSELNFTTIVLSSNRSKPLIHALDILGEVSNIIKVESEEQIVKEANAIVNKFLKN